MFVCCSLCKPYTDLGVFLSFRVVEAHGWPLHEPLNLMVPWERLLCLLRVQWIELGFWDLNWHQLPTVSLEGSSGRWGRGLVKMGCDPLKPCGQIGAMFKLSRLAECSLEPSCLHPTICRWWIAHLVILCAWMRFPSYLRRRAPNLVPFPLWDKFKEEVLV